MWLLTGVLTQGQAIGPMAPIPRMGAAGMQFGPPLLGMHPAAPQLIQGELPSGMRTSQALNIADTQFLFR